ncbi:PhzF family phenazine biosynthesis protein [Deinococcus marmoris]|uniref:Phenazine biosynthesis protein PhzF like n=1 Tax=Deinococcus marmoris TaxID=249408 RepID=A0A1U7NTA2_9DEIO|nr:PhzF family phenazine biosynthesis protein [Deinococcus marmoris]OLV16135.1 Phenazine biosynthesis protein PhzF like [Deinococcus marmoris]
MEKLPYHVVDVFSDAPLRGNPVMVVLVQAELDAAQMQAFAAWNGMPETVYLRRPAEAQDADAYQVRIFSPRTELAFAGHPSLGAAHVALACGLVSPPPFTPTQGAFSTFEGQESTLWQHSPGTSAQIKVLQHPSGNVELFVKTPTPGTVRPLTAGQASAVCQATGSAVECLVYRVSAGANWVVFKLGSAADLASLSPDMPTIEVLSAELGVSGVTVYAPTSAGERGQFEVRSFGPAIGVPEDAVCGGGNACVAALEHELSYAQSSGTPYLTQQGRFVGREGYVHLIGPVEDQRFWLGGTATTVMTGAVNFA